MAETNFTALAKAQDKTTPDSRPFYALDIDGSPYHDNLSEFTVTYALDSGTSEMTINTYKAFEGRENAPVVLSLGYGRSRAEFFRGKLQDPYDNQYGEPNEATAWGPFKWMAESKFGKQVSYEGYRLREALSDMAERSKFRQSQIQVIGGNKILRGEVTYVMEQKIGEAASELCGKSNFVLTDVPGGGRLFMPKPKPVSRGEARAVYTDSETPQGGFTAVRQPRARYAQVWVFRRTTDGQDDFPPVKVNVDTRGYAAPPPFSSYDIPEFTGDAEDALDAGREMSEIISGGTFLCTLSGISANPDIQPFDTLRQNTTELRDEGGRYRERYSCDYRYLVDAEMSVEGNAESGISETVSGTGILVKERKLAKPFYMRMPVTQEHSYVVRG